MSRWWGPRRRDTVCDAVGGARHRPPLPRPCTLGQRGLYTCGRIAALDGDGPVEVTLRLSPPLEVPLRVESVEVGGMAGWLLGAGFLVATAALFVAHARGRK
jgi:hypothetical protein